MLALDCDDANDWAYGLEVTDDLSHVESAFEAVEEAGDYLDARDASNALAACEVLARLNGKPGYQNASTEKVDAWVAAHPLTPPPALLKQANAAIERVLGANSELKELWNQGDAFRTWLAAVDDLRQRLLR